MKKARISVKCKNRNYGIFLAEHEPVIKKSFRENYPSIQLEIKEVK